MAAATPVKEIAGLVADVRRVAATQVTLPLAWRVAQLRGVQRLVEENGDALYAALQKDLSINEFWGRGVELQSVLIEVKDALKHVASWMKPAAASTPLINLPASSSVVPQPFGVALIISPWNYPVSLVLSPLVAALAAGNAVVIKPSEISAHTAAALTELLPKYVDPAAVRVVNGEVPETTELLRQRFDVIMYTGCTAVGKIVMRAAAEHLTPCILELGGKCPVVLAADADLKEAAQRIAWAKWTLNMGQTCISPDYVMVAGPGAAETEARFVAELKAAVEAFYGAEPKQSADVSRIVSARHTERLAAVLADGTGVAEVVCGGAATVDVGARYIAPTVLRCDGFGAKAFEEEIFGPILPVVRVASVDAAVAHVNEGEKPLALYVYSRSKATCDDVLARTSSGGACVNDCAMHTHQHLPFGGVGASGMGAYHGKFGFDAFSHHRGVLRKSAGGGDPALRFAPYTESKLLWLARIRSVDPQKIVTGLGALAAVLVALVAQRFLM